MSMLKYAAGEVAAVPYVKNQFCSRSNFAVREKNLVRLILVSSQTKNEFLCRPRKCEPFDIIVNFKRKI